MRRVEHVMGFPVSVRIDDEGFPEAPVDGLFAWLREVDARFSPFRPDSEVSRLDRGEIAAPGPARAGRPSIRAISTSTARSATAAKFCRTVVSGGKR